MSKWEAIRSISFVGTVVPEGTILTAVDIASLEGELACSYERARYRLAQDHPGWQLIPVQWGESVRWVVAPLDVMLVPRSGVLRRRRVYRGESATDGK